MNKWLRAIELEGKTVKLIPLQKQHREDLLKAATDGELWNLWYTFVPSKDKIDNYIDLVLSEYQNDQALPFVVLDKATNCIIGSTRFCHATSAHRRVEVGYTWYSKTYQKTRVNSECKLLLLTHAFETLDCIAVEFRTHWHNLASRNAIARLGAKQDGVLRNHQIDAEGVLRDTVVFSIVREEWPTVKRALQFKLERSA